MRLEPQNPYLRTPPAPLLLLLLLLSSSSLFLLLLLLLLLFISAQNCCITVKMIDVFHRQCLSSILGISWRDHVTNDQVMVRSGQLALHDIVATRRRRFVGHILRLLATRPASLALGWNRWIPEGGRRRVGRPLRTWQDTLKEDLETMGVDWSDVRDTASDRARWRQLVARCSTWNGRNYTLSLRLLQRHFYCLV